MDKYGEGINSPFHPCNQPRKEMARQVRAVNKELAETAHERERDGRDPLTGVRRSKPCGHGGYYGGCPDCRQAGY